jgi:hypothetical protein
MAFPRRNFGEVKSLITYYYGPWLFLAIEVASDLHW